MVLLASMTAASAQPATGRGSQEAPAVTAAADSVRITYAGTDHRSLGRVTGTATSEPFFGPGPAHFDKHPFSRNGATVFISLRDSRQPQVYLRTASGEIRKLTDGRNAAHPQLTPDGRSVVFDSSEPGGPDGQSQRDLWIVGTDGTGMRKLTDSPDDEQWPTVSPDGTRIAYVSDDVCACGQVYVRDLAGGEATQVTQVGRGDALDPVWNPVNDAEHRDLIAYTLDAGGDTGPRLRVTTPAGEEGPLLAGAQADWRTSAADWLPDGDGLLFLGESGYVGEGNHERAYRSAAGSSAEPQLLLDEDRNVNDPTLLTSGSDPGSGGDVLVSRTSAAAPNIATLQDVRPDGADPRDLGVTVLEEDPSALTNTDPAADPLFNPAEGYDPWTERQSYTPDGREIVVTRFEDSAAGRVERIWLTGADGSNPRPMELADREPGDWDTDPAFSPDGKYLAFTRTSPGGVGGASGPGRILVAEVATGEIVGTVEPPEGQGDASDAQPTWSSDGKLLAFTRTAVINGNGGNKHIWTAPADALGEQTDLSAKMCPGACEVIDDSPAFSPDGNSLAFNRKDGGGRVNERNGVLLAQLGGGTCQVVLPEGLRDTPNACAQDLPDTSASGPFQPRDVAWSPDASQLVLSSRRSAAPNSPEALSVLNLGSGELTRITGYMPGRQKEPAFQQSVDLALTAPGTSDTVRTGGSTSVTVTVTNNGPSPSPGTTFTVAPPAGVRLDELTTSTGQCEAETLQCDLGTLAPGASVQVTARIVGVTEGEHRVGWSVTGTVLDPNPSDNAGETVVPVEAEEPTPTPTPTPTDEPTPTPTPTPTDEPTPTPTPTPGPGEPSPTPPPPDATEAGPGVSLNAQPNPGYVGGRVTLSYTVRNRGDALATGLRLRLGLPEGVPTERLPGGCTRTACELGDLKPGASSVIRVVLAPKKALKTTVTGRLTTTGTDADRSDNTAKEPLRILQPRIVAVPDIGKPGFVTSVRGKDFPPGAPVKLRWKPGITASAAPTRPAGSGKFTAQLLILAKDQTGPRTITARGPGFSAVKTDFLVVNGSVQPPDEVARR
ncbi:hypothetical protein GCM10027091_19280 [Streptomyces daliensis]